MDMIKTILNKLNSIIIAGIVILLFGVYYLLTKGGVLLPFHDAPEDVLWVYNINADTARTLNKLGFIIFIVGIVYQIIKSIYIKQKNIKQKDNIIDLIVMIMLGVVLASGLITLRGFIYLGDELDVAATDIGFGYSYSRTIWTSLIVKSSIVYLSSSLLTSILIFCDPKTSNIIAYVLLVVIWSVFCFLVWSTSELFANEPIIGRIAVFLSKSMGIIWLFVPIIFVIIKVALNEKKQSKIAAQTVEQDSEVQQ